MKNENVNLQDLTLTNMPKDKKLIVFSYGNIYQNETNFNIAIILKELYKKEPEYFIRYLNLKEIFAFLLGTVIDNQYKTVLNAGRIASFQINIQKGLLDIKTIKEITSLKIFMGQLPNKIDNYNLEWHKNRQNYSTFIDNLSGRTIIFPHYEIARYFYFTSSSMTRQIMAGSLDSSKNALLLDGLYKKAFLEKGNGEIYLNFNANNNDAENIFRFVIDEYAKNMWYQVRRDLTASRIKIAEEKRNRGFESNTPYMIFQANFPTTGVVNFVARAVKLDDYNFLVLRILQEDTFYPFIKLKVIREIFNGKENIIGIIKKEAPVKKNLTNKINTSIPNNVYEQVNVIDRDNDDDLEIKLDLLNKKITFETQINYEEDKDTTKKTDISEKELDLSPNNTENRGNLNTAEENLKEAQDDTAKDYITIEDLKKMLLYCAEKYEEFSYKILKDECLPQKPRDYKGRYAWNRSIMCDKKTPRKYIIAEIKYKNSKYLIIEIEKDKLNDALSSLIIEDKYNNIDQYIINKIIINIAKTSNSWLQGLGLKITNKYLYHPHERSEEKIQDWGDRLIDALEKFDSYGNFYKSL